MINIKFKACPDNRTDGKEKFWELSGNRSVNRMEIRFGGNCPESTEKTGWNQHGHLFHPVSSVLMSFIYLLFLPRFRVDENHFEKYYHKQNQQ